MFSIASAVYRFFTLIFSLHLTLPYHCCRNQSIPPQGTKKKRKTNPVNKKTCLGKWEGDVRILLAVADCDPSFCILHFLMYLINAGCFHLKDKGKKCGMCNGVESVAYCGREG